MTAEKKQEKAQEKTAQKGRKPISIPTVMSELYSRPAEVMAEQEAFAEWAVETFAPVPTDSKMGAQTRKVLTEGVRIGLVVNTRPALIRAWWNESEACKVFRLAKAEKVRDALIASKLAENPGLRAAWETFDDKTKDALVASWI